MRRPPQLNNCRSNGGDAGESGDMQSLVNRVGKRESSTPDLFVFKDFCTVIGDDRDIPHRGKMKK